MKIIAVKDLKADLFLQPTFQANISDATRSWSVIANEGESIIRRFPHEFHLYCLGEFNSNNGEFNIFKHPQHLGSAADFQTKSDSQPQLQSVNN